MDETHDGGAAAASDNPLWGFACAVYAARGVADACLALQDREGLDVNLLLFCCWAGRHGHTLTTAQLESLDAAIRPWQREVTQALRRARTWLKTEGDGSAEVTELRAAIKHAELDAERLAQAKLWWTLPLAPGEPDIGAMVANIQAYFGLLGRTPGPLDTADLVTVVLASLPQAVRALDLVRRFEDGHRSI